MERYLVFDAGCSVCSRLARQVQSVVGEQITIVSIHDDAAKTLLDRAYPRGWDHAPYLVFASDEDVQGWRGIHAALRLGLLIGPRSAWQVCQLMHHEGTHTQLAHKLLPPSSPSRRRLLKLGAVLAGTGLLSSQNTRAALAGVGCEEVNCYEVGSMTTCRTSCGSCPRPLHCNPNSSDKETYNDCYDSSDGGFCYTRTELNCNAGGC